VNTSCNDPEECLAAMITNMPEMAKMLLDKCVTTKGTKDNPASYQVIYDFFCLESTSNCMKNGFRGGWHTTLYCVYKKNLLVAQLRLLHVHRPITSPTNVAGAAKSCETFAIIF